jgi:hypothetical protein
MKSFPKAFKVSSTMAINHAEPWIPKKKMNPQNPFLLSSNWSLDTPTFAEKEKHFASTEKHRSIFAKTEELQDKAPWRHTHETPLSTTNQKPAPNGLEK